MRSLVLAERKALTASSVCVMSATLKAPTNGGGGGGGGGGGRGDSGSGDSGSGWSKELTLSVKASSISCTARPASSSWSASQESTLAGLYARLRQT
eukprot:scaffold819_cov239-Pinguiococcus_pyrenoidosus.AAC.10